MNQIDQVSIKIQVGAYTAYRNMQNKLHYAIAEYVDNAIQSYLDNKEVLHQIHNNDYKCRIDIDINKDEDYIRISDNAAGISYDNFIRAFEPANIPIDNTGLHEFGMGLKIASIWLADIYTVTSTPINERIIREVTFNLNKVIDENKEILKVKNTSTKFDNHYTTIYLSQLSNNIPSRTGRSLTKIKKHISSIYRKYLSTNEIIITFNGEVLTYEYPKILSTVEFDNTVEWKQNVEFSAGRFKMKGFVALMESMSASDAGFSLFRRGRVIQGSHDEKYHSTILSGQLGSPLDKRLFGEFELEGFNVSFDKGSFREMDELDELLSLIKEDLVKREYNILKKGRTYRKPITKDKTKVVSKTLKKLKNDSFDNEKKKKLELNLKDIKKKPASLNKAVKIKNKKEDIFFDFAWLGVEYTFKIRFTDQAGMSLLQLNKDDNKQNHWLGTINMGHVFFENYSLYSDVEKLEPVLEIFKSMLISEVISIHQGTKKAGFLRSNLDKILK